MDTISNVKSIRAVHKLHGYKPISFTFIIPHRAFAEGEGISRPADGKYKNVFNKENHVVVDLHIIQHFLMITMNHGHFHQFITNMVVI